jgi:hypothetical protein
MRIEIARLGATPLCKKNSTQSSAPKENAAEQGHSLFRRLQGVERHHPSGDRRENAVGSIDGTNTSKY